MDELTPLENWAAPLLARKIGTELRRSQSQRIGKQQAPPWHAVRAAEATATAEVRTRQTREDVRQVAAGKVLED